jgi:DNA recombination protein RmuC
MEFVAIVVSLTGLIIGALAGWLAASAHAAGRIGGKLGEAESRAAGASAEAATIRTELESSKREIASLHDSLREAEAAKAGADARCDEMQRGIGEQREALKQAQAALSSAFKSLAAEALSNNNQQFLTLAKENLTALETKAVADLDARHKAIEGVVGPVRESLGKMDEQIRAIEKARGEAYGTLSEQVQSLARTQAELRSETSNLVKALRAPAVRGRWGEIQLKRVVELAGMINRCDFLEQQTVQGGEGKLRPDLCVQLPGGKNIIVDAKAPLQAYLESLEAPTDEIRNLKLKEHARQVRDHMGKLAAKTYWDYLKPTPEFVVLFLPGETFFSAALEQDPSLIEQGVNERVILATPTTLIALLRAVAYGWRQEQIAENAGKISQLGQELYDRLATSAGHVASLGAALKNSVDRYNDAVGSLESRVLISARRFKELGVAAKAEIKELQPIEVVPRELAPSLLGNGAPEIAAAK